VSAAFGYVSQLSGCSTTNAVVINSAAFGDEDAHLADLFERHLLKGT
jgi:hypothetical protein